MTKKAKEQKTEKVDVTKHEGVIFVHDGVDYKAGDAIPFEAWKNVIETHQMALAMNYEEFKDLDAQLKTLAKELAKSEPELRDELQEAQAKLKYVVKSVEAFAISLDKAIKL